MKSHRHIVTLITWRDPHLIEGIVAYAKAHSWSFSLRYYLSGRLPNLDDGEGLIATDNKTTEVSRFIKRYSKTRPVVILGTQSPDPTLPRVEEDHKTAGQIAADYFLDRSYENFAWIGAKADYRPEQLRYQGFASALNEHGFDCPKINFSEDSLEEHKIQAVCQQLKRLDRPLALMAHNDLVSIELISALMSYGLHVPDDIAIIGTGNTPILCECSPVSLSSIELNPMQIGYQGAHMLDRLLNGEDLSGKVATVPCGGLIERQSSNHFATKHPGVSAALRFIREHTYEPIGDIEIAEAAGMSVSGLKKAFTRELPHSPSIELKNQRLKRACYLLKHSDLKIAAIADEAGLGSPSYFCMIFRKTFGKTPDEWRKDNCK